MHTALLTISPRETRTFLSSPSGGGLQNALQRLANGVLAGAVGDTRLFVSGGAEHQGPDGGGPVAVIARV